MQQQLDSWFEECRQQAAEQWQERKPQRSFEEGQFVLVERNVTATPSTSRFDGLRVNRWDDVHALLLADAHTGEPALDGRRVAVNVIAFAFSPVLAEDTAMEVGDAEVLAIGAIVDTGGKGFNRNLLVGYVLGMHARRLCLRTRVGPAEKSNGPWAAQQWELMGCTVEIEPREVMRRVERSRFGALKVRTLEEMQTSGINVG